MEIEAVVREFFIIHFAWLRYPRVGLAAAHHKAPDYGRIYLKSIDRPKLVQGVRVCYDCLSDKIASKEEALDIRKCLFLFRCEKVLQ